MNHTAVIRSRRRSARASSVRRASRLYTHHVIRSLQRVPAWLPWLLAAIGVVGLLLPWLLSPVTSDERYHYAAGPVRMSDSVFNVLPWTINDIGWRMAQGRIAPVGVFVQHVIYLLGMKFAFSTGVPLFVAHGIVKVLLLAAAVSSFALVLSQLRRRDGERLDPRTRATAVLVFTGLLVLGVTTSYPERNGWTTFIVLCIGGITLMFLVGAASLWVLRGWSRWGALGKVLSGVGILVLGVVVMLSYEMHWAAIPFAIVLLAIVGRAIWPHRLILIGLLGGAWLAALLWTRSQIAAVANHSYAGLEVDLGGPIVKVIGLQLLNAVPGSGIPYVALTVGDGLSAPRPFEGGGWLWGTLLALGLVLLLRHNRPLPGVEEVSGDRHPLIVLGAALAASALAAAVILSVSEQAHDIVRFPGATYRGTPWIWACSAGILTAGLLVLPRRDRFRRTAIVAVPAAFAVLVGAFVWPFTVSAIQTQRALPVYLIWEQAQAELITGSAEPMAVEHRCLLTDEALKWADGSAYRIRYVKLYEASFAHQWGRPWCESSPKLK
jgi:hypothetical protein